MTIVPELPARYYARMGEILQRHGVDVAALLQAAGVRPQLFAEPGAMLRLDQVETLLAEAARLSGRSDLGFELGRSLRISTHSVVGYGILSSPTIDYAMRLTARFFRLLSPTFRMRCRRDAAQAEIRFEPALPLSHGAFVFHVETIAVAIHSALYELLQDQMPSHQLLLSIAEPPHAARYAELEGARVQFGWTGATGLCLRLPAAVMDRPPILADPNALQLAEARCAALLRDAVAEGRVADWVRMMLREASDGLPTLTELAHTLNLSQRTLDRHLQREGQGFRELLAQVRQERARDLLAAGRMTVTQIALELGYSDAANFTRAFRREAGISPSEYRLKIEKTSATDLHG
ncbi:MAG TPA: AraC family transcriptional regulator [Solimonas sp.]|nr:AraC family transcriptional regulator [Solimonas sp.]